MTSHENCKKMSSFGRRFSATATPYHTFAAAKSSRCEAAELEPSMALWMALLGLEPLAGFDMVGLVANVWDALRLLVVHHVLR